MNKEEASVGQRDRAFPPGLSRPARRVLAQAETLCPTQRHLVAAALQANADRASARGDEASTATAPAFLPAVDAEAARARRALFASSAWARTFVPGLEVHVYVLGNLGLQSLALALGGARPIWKVGTVLVGGLDKRMAELKRQAYAGLIRNGSDYAEEDGFRDWRPPPRLQLGAPMPLGPVRVSRSSLVVTLPAGVSHGRFESDLTQALQPISLASVADSDAGRAWVSDCGVPIHRLIRFSRRSTRVPVQAATECYLFRPQTDGPALAALLEDLVIGTVGLPRDADNRTA